MKKLFIYQSILIVISILIITCKKVDVQKPNETKVQVENVVPTPPVGEYTKWSWQEEKCVPTTDEVCCHKPTSAMNAVMTALYESFVYAFEHNDLPDFFENEDYLDLWPTLIDEDIVTDIIEGNARVIKHTSSSVGYDYYLVGQTSQTDNQIFENPAGTIYIEE